MYQEKKRPSHTPNFEGVFSSFLLLTVSPVILDWALQVPWGWKTLKAIFRLLERFFLLPSSLIFERTKKRIRTAFFLSFYGMLEKSRFLFALNLASPCTPTTNRTGKMSIILSLPFGYTIIAGGLFSAKRLRYFFRHKPFYIIVFPLPIPYG